MLCKQQFIRYPPTPPERIHPFILYLTVLLDLKCILATCSTIPLNDFIGLIVMLQVSSGHFSTTKWKETNKYKATFPCLEILKHHHHHRLLHRCQFNFKQNCVTGSDENEPELKLSYRETRKTKRRSKKRTKMQIEGMTNSWDSFSIKQREINQQRSETTDLLSQPGPSGCCCRAAPCLCLLLQFDLEEQKQTHEQTLTSRHTGGQCLPGRSLVVWLTLHCQAPE